MAKKEVEVIFKTITPLWTGDAWQNNSSIRPSSLIGSLRFWFEVLMYFGGVLKKEDFNSQTGRFEKEVDRGKLRKYIEKNGNDIEGIIKHLVNEQKIPISSVVFGTTNWRSLIEIKGIEPIEDYCFGNKLGLPYVIGIKKDNYAIEEFSNEAEWKEKINQYSGKTFKDKLQEARKEYSFFFFSQPYFFGNLKVKFLVEESILEPIFYPLINFMDKYGFWGGKWNIGYGRLRIENISVVSNIEDIKNKNEINLERFYINGSINKSISFIEGERDSVLEIVRNFNDLTNSNDKKIKILKNKSYNNNNLKTLIRKLIKIKAQKRSEFRVSKVLKHKIFGTVNPPPPKQFLPQGSKVLPYIYEKNGHTAGGFLSIVGFLNLEKESKESRNE